LGQPCEFYLSGRLGDPPLHRRLFPASGQYALPENHPEADARTKTAALLALHKAAQSSTTRHSRELRYRRAGAAPAGLMVRLRRTFYNCINLVLTTCTRVQTVLIFIQTILLHPYTRTNCTTQSIQLYRWDDRSCVQMYTPDGSTRTTVPPASHRCTAVSAGQCMPHGCGVHAIRDAQVYAPYYSACAPVLG
jgi:hypothetical protein